MDHPASPSEPRQHKDRAIEQHLVFPSIPARLAYFSSKSHWLNAGVALVDIQGFCEVVTEVYSEHRRRRLKIDNDPIR